MMSKSVCDKFETHGYENKREKEYNHHPLISNLFNNVFINLNSTT